MERQDSPASSAEGFFSSEHKDHTVDHLNEHSPETIKRRYADHRNKTVVGFERANWKQALKIKEMSSNRYCDGREVSVCVRNEHFKQYGIGIHLFFLFLEKLLILFTVLSLVNFIPLCYNFINGDRFSDSMLSFQVIIAMFTSGNQSNTDRNSESIADKLICSIPDILCVLLFMGFYFYWGRLSKKETDALKRIIKYPSDFTIELIKFPNKFNEEKAQKFFQKFGPVKEVAAVRNYSEMIQLSKQAYESSLEIKEAKLVAKAGGKQEDPEQTAKKEMKINGILEQLQKVQKSLEREIIKFYIVFEHEESKETVLRSYEEFQKACYCCCKGNHLPTQDLLIEGALPEVKSCEVQPSGIVWQNMHITWRSRWIRFIVQTVLLIALISAAFIAISLLNIMTPSTTTDTSYSNYTYQEIKNESSFAIVQSWCLNVDLTTTEQNQFCDYYISVYYRKIAVTVGISLLIVIFKQILKLIVIAIAKFQRYKDHTQTATNVMTNLMITYICTTVLITFLLQANIFGLSFKRVVKIFTSNASMISNAESLTDYDDFTNDWYVDIGYQIWLNWLILAFIPHSLMPIYHFLWEKIRMRIGKKQLLQRNMVDWIQGEEFQIEDHYANVLMIVFVGFTFSGGIPFMTLLSLLGLATRYIYFKYAFIRYSRVPKSYTVAMNNRVKLIIPLVIVFHILLSIWMLGVDEIFGGTGFDFLNKWVQATSSQTQKQFVIILKKLIDTWYMTVLLGIIVAVFVFKKIFFDRIRKLFKKSHKETQLVYSNQSKAGTGLMRMNSAETNHYSAEENFLNPNILTPANREDLKITQRALTASYKIENNPDYIQILAIMKPTSAKEIIRSTINLEPQPDHILQHK